MAITYATIGRVWSGTRSYGGGDSYTVNYLVRSDDRDDGPQQIIDAFQSGTIAGEAVPKLGETYSFGNDDDPFLVCTEVTPDRIEHSGGQEDGLADTVFAWNVALKFKPVYDQQTQEKETVDGSHEATTNPLEFRRELDISFQFRTEEAQRLPFCGVFLNSAPNTLKNVPYDESTGVRRSKNIDLQQNPLQLSGHLGQGANSAGEGVDPPYMIQRADAIITITQNVSAYPFAWFGYPGSINSHDLSLTDTFFNITDWSFPRATLFCLDAGGPFAFTNRVRYYKPRFSFAYRESGWYVDGLDHGANQFNADLELEAIKDKDGVPVAEFQLLDGSGKHATQASINNSYYMRYLPTDNLKDYGQLPIGFTYA